MKRVLIAGVMSALLAVTAAPSLAQTSTWRRNQASSVQSSRKKAEGNRRMTQRARGTYNRNDPRLWPNRVSRNQNRNRTRPTTRWNRTSRSRSTWNRSSSNMHNSWHFHRMNDGRIIKHRHMHDHRTHHKWQDNMGLRGTESLDSVRRRDGNARWDNNGRRRSNERSRRHMDNRDWNRGRGRARGKEKEHKHKENEKHEHEHEHGGH